MARQSFKFFTPRDKPKKRGPRQHKKSLNKSEKRQKKDRKNKEDTKARVDKDNIISYSDLLPGYEEL